MMGSKDGDDFERELASGGEERELTNLDGGRVLGEDDSGTELEAYPARGKDVYQGFDDAGRTTSNLSRRDVEELQRVRVAVPAGKGEDEEDDLSDFDSDISDDEEGTARAGGEEGAAEGAGVMAGSGSVDQPTRVGGVTLENIDDIKQHAYELENEFNFDFADTVMPSFVE
jgi:hypothetical protein